MIIRTYITGILLIVVFSLKSLCVTLENWPVITPQLDAAVRSQRDVSNSIPIDQITGIGVSLNRLVFDKKGYTTKALDDVRTLLNVGVQTLMVDLFWNEFTNKWQLCPGPFFANATSDLSTTTEVKWDQKKYKCEAYLTIDRLMQTINAYLLDSNTNLDVNIIQILFSLKSIHKDPPLKNETHAYELDFSSSNPYFLALGNSTLKDSLASIGTYLFTPSNFLTYKNGRRRSDSDEYNSFYNLTEAFPSQYNFLLSDYKRIVAIIIEDDMAKSSDTYHISSLDKETIFVEGTNLDATIDSISNATIVGQCSELVNSQGANNLTNKFDYMSLKSHFRVIADNNQTTFTNNSLSDFVRCGYTPVLNASMYNVYEDDNEDDDVEEEDVNDSLPFIVNNFMPLSLWTWAESEITNRHQGLNMSDSNDQDDDDDDDINKVTRSIAQDNSKIAYRCVVIDSTGWKIRNCYEQHPYACQKTDHPNDWFIDPKKRKEYFHAFLDKDCPKGYTFSNPLLSIEMLSLMDYIKGNDISYPVWMDINDITVSNCFVTGGPYSSCPYQRTVTKLKLARLIAPSFIVAVAVIVLIFFEKFFRTNPIQTNRKRHWKKAINEYDKKYGYEGVPS